MSDASKAVFLSYASQDAEAAKKICDALRTVGVEVWFDQSELTGGDAWDAKIRKQIAECALFAPLISAATQARREGYFRLEWRIAAQRTHMMSEQIAFLLPVVIDATRDVEADVPAEFKAVQWTRLAQGASPAKFCGRVKKLLGGEDAPVSDRRSDTVGASLDDARGRGRATPLQKAARPWLISAITVVVALVVIVIWQPWKNRKTTAATNAAAKSTLAPTSATQPLLDRMAAIYEKGGDASAEDIALAMELGAKAVALDDLSADSWAAYAQATKSAYYWGGGVAPELYAQALTRAQRAVSLSGDSFEARFALASVYVQKDATAKEGERMLRQLVAERPADGRMLRRLSAVLDSAGQLPEALTIIDRALGLSARDVTAWNQRASILHQMGRIAEAQEAVGKSLAIRVGARALMEKAYILVFLTDDYPAAAAVIEQLPGSVLTRELETWAYGVFWLNDRQPEKALATFAAFGGDTLRGTPKTCYTGTALAMLGRKEAAQVEWRTALNQIETKLTAKPNDPDSLLWKAELLALLGERTEAERTLEVARQLADPMEIRVAETLATLGRREAAISDLMERWAKLKDFYNAVMLRTYVLHDPAFDPLRDDPRFQAFVQTVRDDPRFPIPKKATAGAQTVDDKSAPAAKSVAVLAFADLSAAHDSEYFSDGISDELINALGKVPGLKVPGRTSSFHFKGKDTPIPDIAKQLGVAYVIEGSVQRLGDKVKIGARLTKAADGFQMWSETFLRDAKDVFAVEAEIAGVIAKQLSLKLGTSSMPVTAAVNPEAFELYLRGREAWNRRTDEGYDRAEALFSRAIELDPDFARAYVGQADVLDLRAIDRNEIGRWDQRKAEVFGRIHALLDQALRLDPESAEAQASLGDAYFDEWRFSEAIGAARRAVALNPNYATGWHWLGLMLWERGEIDEALVDLRRAVEIDPYSLAINTACGQCLRNMGRPSEALEFLSRALQLQPDAPRALASRAMTLIDLGRTAEAGPLIRALLQSERGRGWWQTGMVVARAGLAAETEELLAHYRQTGESQRVAPMLAVLGRRNEFLDAWQRLPMTTSEPWYLWEPFTDDFRSDPKFLRALEKVGLTEAHARAQAWRKAHPPEKPAAKD